jgi:hypothetical protein
VANGETTSNENALDTSGSLDVYYGLSRWFAITGEAGLSFS